LLGVAAASPAPTIRKIRLVKVRVAVVVLAFRKMTSLSC